MATDVLRRRTKAQAAARAARARRERKLLVAGALVLAALLAFEGPKTLRSLRGSSSAPAPTHAPASTSPGHTAAAPKSESQSQSVVSRFAAKDPFVPQLGVNGTPPSGPTPSKPPRVRDSHFVAKDPFKQQLAPPASSASAPAATPAVPPKVLPPRPVAKKKAAPTSKKAGSAPAVKAHASAPSQSAPHLTKSVHGIVVVLESVPVGRGIVAAKRVAVAARTRGVPKANLLFSSRYPALRSGFYAVYSGPYSTSARALNALKLARESGYASAYVRRLGH